MEDISTHRDNDFYQTESANFKRITKNGKKGDEIVEAKFFYVHHGHRLHDINEKLEKMGMEAVSCDDLFDFFEQHKLSLLSSPYFQFSSITTTNSDAIQGIEAVINTMEKPTSMVLLFKDQIAANKGTRALPAIMKTLRDKRYEPTFGMKLIQNSYLPDHAGILIMAVKKQG